MKSLLPAILGMLMVLGASASAPSSAQSGAQTWFVPPPPNQGAVSIGGKVAPGGVGDVEQVTVIGHRRPLTWPLEIPDLLGEDTSRYRRAPDYLTRSHRAPCAETYASVGGHEGRGSSLASGLGAAGCD